MSFFAHRRRDRGYAFESSIVKYFNSEWDNDEGWYARRLGGSSVGLPDVVVTNNYRSIFFSIEAKSTFQGEAYIPSDQIQRCADICNVFGVYDKRHIVFAFKFSKNIEKGRDKLQQYFFKAKPTNIDNIKWVKCFYDGRLRYKTINPDIKSELKIIEYRSLPDLKNNVIQKRLKVEA